MTMRSSIVCLLLAVALPASAEQFGGSRLFVNQSLKYDTGRTFSLGVDFTIAPVKVAKQAIVGEIKKQIPPEQQELLVTGLKYIPPEKLENLSVESLKAELAGVAQLTPDQKAELNGAVDQLPAEQADLVLSLLPELANDTETTITFSLEPYATFELDLLDIRLSLPLAGFSGEETEFAVGNIGADFKFGHIFGKGMAFGLSYGASLYVPTATEQANALGLANLAWSPRYFSEFMTATPYLIMGADLMFVTLQANVGANMMFEVKGDSDIGNVTYLQWGGALSITAIPMFIISAELSGLTGLDNADAYDAMFMTAGLRFASSIIDIGLAFQLPLTVGDSSDVASFSNVDFASPSDLNVILSATFGL